MLAPIALPSGQSGAEALDVEQIPGEASLRPNAGEAVTIAGRKHRWRAATLDQDYTIDFNGIVGRETMQSVAYAVCYIQSDGEQRGLEMRIGSDDDAKICLNGNEVHKHIGGRALTADEDVVPDITLTAGLNVLVFKVVNQSQGWQGSIRVTDADGNPVKGIRVTLTP